MLAGVGSWGVAYADTPTATPTPGSVVVNVDTSGIESRLDALNTVTAAQATEVANGVGASQAVATTAGEISASVDGQATALAGSQGTAVADQQAVGTQVAALATVTRVDEQLGYAQTETLWQVGVVAVALLGVTIAGLVIWR